MPKEQKDVKQKSKKDEIAFPTPRDVQKRLRKLRTDKSIYPEELYSYLIHNVTQLEMMRVEEAEFYFPYVKSFERHKEKLVKAVEKNGWNVRSTVIKTNWLFILSRKSEVKETEDAMNETSAQDKN